MPGPTAPSRRAATTLLGTAACAVLAVATAAPAAALAFDRLQGPDRYATAVEISRAAFPDGADAVVVASGTGFADALAGAPAAAVLDAPMLLTAPGGLPEVVRAEVRRLGPVDALVLGGRSAVSDAVLAELRELGVNTLQVSGSNRYDTAAGVAVDVMAPPAGSVEVLIASGEGFADGLAGGAYGAATGSPLLLTGRDALPAETAEALRTLQPRTITVLGGPAVVSAAVEASLAAYTTGAVTRVQGSDRYETAAGVARRMPSPAREATPLLAAGASFPDALAGAALGQPLLLSERDCLPDATAAALADLGAGDVVALGGTAVLSDRAASGGGCAAPPAAQPAQPTQPTQPTQPGADLDCPDFASKADAQATFDALYPQHGDVYGLDSDDDREACESQFA